PPPSPSTTLFRSHGHIAVHVNATRLLLPDRVLRLRRPGEADHRELALDLDHRAVARLLLVRPELRARIRVDERVPHVEDVELVANLDARQRSEIDPGPRPFDLDDLPLDAS